MIFDLDGVLADSEQLWDRLRREVVAAHSGSWGPGATEAMMGMSTPEWSAYLVEQLGARATPEDIAEHVIERMAEHYTADPPILPDAVPTVRTVAERYPTAIASSAPPRIIRAFLDTTGLGEQVGTAVSSEQVGAGKPAPDVYLEAAAGLGADPARCAAVEDSASGLRAAAAAGMTVFAVPNPHFPPPEEALALTHRVLRGIARLPDALADLAEEP
ncbi:HAD family phosphatase [Saccharopolyspora sp. HNM0983]|uniref:HAD family phosphatase n=1 Tax=Saccharopolyspora montiporae TaxID=2781240 RepID=A0A929BAJ0_9PSEU|nr:HAD family phosphatase [Saccharopolyspora sp. HNM0983]